MIITILNIISVTTVFLLLLFSLFLFNSSKGNKISKRILAYFLTSNAIFILDYLLVENHFYAILKIDYLTGIGFLFGFLFGPLLFLYTKSITKPNFSLQRNYIYHFFMFFVTIISFAFGNIINISVVVFTLHIQILIYMLASLRKVEKYRIEIKNYYSTIEKHNLSWLVLVLFAFIFMWVVDLTFFILTEIDIKYFEYNEYFGLLSLTINFLFANIIVYRGLTHSDIFIDINKEEVAKKYEKSTLTEKIKKSYLNQIIEIVESEKLYLIPGITLIEIAKKLEIHPKYLSQVINEYLGKNFHEFIKTYRIDEAKKLIENSLEDQKTILEILYECGFNTKSSFNKSFKEIVGITPSEYKLSFLE